MPVNLSNFAFLDIQVVDYCCINNKISKSKAVNLLQNVDLTEEEKLFEKII